MERVKGTTLERLVIPVVLALAVSCSSSSSGSTQDGGGSGSSSGGPSEDGAADGASSSSGSSASSSSSGGRSDAANINVGDPCTADSQCPAIGLTTPVCMTSWPNGGYCTNNSCAGGLGQCPSSAQCATYMGVTRCFAFCQPGAIACRAGYTCTTDGACVPQ